MSTPTSRVAVRIRKAKDFDDQYHAALDDDLKVIAAFYAALHWMAAAFETAHYPRRVPNSHVATEELYATARYAIPDHITGGYGRLRVLSEIARYSLDEDEWISEEDVEKADALLDRVRDWAIAQMPGDWTK